MSFSLKQKFIATVVVSCLLIVGSSFGFWWLLQNVAGAEVRLRTLEEQIASLADEKQVARRTAVIFEDYAKDIERIRGIFVKRGEPVEFIEALEGLAKNTANKISLEFDEGQSTNESLMFRVKLEGVKKNVFKYLNLIELMPYQVTVEEFTLERMGSTETVPPVGAAKGSVPAALHRLQLVIRVKAHGAL